MALQPDGRIVSVGEFSKNETFALLRFLPDGKLDPSFGDHGKISTDFGSGAAGAEAVLIQPDGKIVAAGQSLRNVALARYLAS